MALNQSNNLHSDREIEINKKISKLQMKIDDERKKETRMNVGMIISGVGMAIGFFSLAIHYYISLIIFVPSLIALLIFGSIKGQMDNIPKLSKELEELYRNKRLINKSWSEIEKSREIKFEKERQERQTKYDAMASTSSGGRAPSICPSCKTKYPDWKRVESGKKGFSKGKATIGGALFGTVGLLAGLDGKYQHTYHCSKCGYSNSYEKTNNTY